MSTVADKSKLPASSLSTLPSILPFGVLAVVVVCVLVILLLVTALGTCICCMARRRKVKRGGGEESGYWGPEESDLSESSSCTGEILREEEESSVSDVMYRLEIGGPHLGMAPPSPSIFSQGDLLMEDISENKRSVVESSSPLRENKSNDVIDMVDDIQDFSYCRIPRSASTVALHSVDLDSPVLSYQGGGDTGDLTVDPCGDGRAQEGGWLLYSIMREIQNSSKDKVEDEVFISSTEQGMINSKLDLRKSINSRQGREGVCSEIEVENVMEKKNSSNGIGQVLVDAKDDKTMIEPLEVRVIVKTVGDN